MSCAVTWTAADVAALEKSIADGVETVKYSDKEVTYRSLEEMLQLLSIMKAAVCGDANGGGRFARVFAKSSKGLC